MNAEVSAWRVLVRLARVAAGGYSIAERLNMAGSDPNQASDRRSAVADDLSLALMMGMTVVGRLLPLRRSES